MKKAVLLLILLFMGCATTQMPVTPIKNTKIYNASFPKVWNELITVISDLEIPVKSIDKNNGTFISESIDLKGDIQQKLDAIAYPPRVGMGVWSRAEYSYNISVKSLSEKQTRVQISVNIEGYEGKTTKSWYDCTSQGILENDVFEKITANIGNAPPETTLVPEKKPIVDVMDDGMQLTTPIKIVNVVKNYILVQITDKTPMALNESYRISRNGKAIGTATVVKVNKNKIALKVESDLEITTSDILDY